VHKGEPNSTNQFGWMAVTPFFISEWHQLIITIIFDCIHLKSSKNLFSDDRSLYTFHVDFVGLNEFIVNHIFGTNRCQKRRGMDMTFLIGVT
jgi:hypothetical protein